MNFLLEVAKDQKLPINEALSFGGEVLLTGMLTVLGVLVILWFTLIFFIGQVKFIIQKSNMEWRF